MGEGLKSRSKEKKIWKNKRQEVKEGERGKRKDF